MSHTFLEEQVHEHRRCTFCKEGAFTHQGRTYSLCTRHLAYARDMWRLHCRRQMAKGQCINCHRRKLPGELRCAACKEVNRVRALTWTRAHPEHGHQNWLKVRSQYLVRGYCVCKGHPKLPPGFRRCDDCRARHKTYKRKDLQAPTARV